MVDLQFHSVERLYNFSRNCDQPSRGKWYCNLCGAYLSRFQVRERTCQGQVINATGLVKLRDTLSGMYLVEQWPTRKVLLPKYVDKQLQDEVNKGLLRDVPGNVAEAEELVRRDPFKFEEWVCRALGAEGNKSPLSAGSGYGPSAALEAAGMFSKGDGGIDGVLRFFPPRMGKKANKNFAIIQVKGGKFTPESVRALRGTVAMVGATAGIFVCFNRYMRVVDNHGGAETFSDNAGRTYPVIQGLSVEDVLAGKGPDLPVYKSRWFFQEGSALRRVEMRNIL